MWYKASSVVKAVLKNQKLKLDDGEIEPSCPKNGNKAYCLENFPECDGKIKECHQHLRVVNERGDPSILYFDYYISKDERDGLIKKLNSTLILLIKKYEIDEGLMIPA